MIVSSVVKNLDELIGLLQQLSDIEYSNPRDELSNSSIGEHTRHIIEMFHCIVNQYHSGHVNYDQRPRNEAIQTQTLVAIDQIVLLQHQLKKQNKDLVLQQIIEGTMITIQTNYFRELLYNFEHCIHHQALIKVAVLKWRHITIDDNFGVARSTIEYRKKCAQ